LTRDDILATIRANEAELRKFQVTELALFGSFARGEETDAPRTLERRIDVARPRSYERSRGGDAEPYRTHLRSSSSREREGLLQVSGHTRHRELAHADRVQIVLDQVGIGSSVPIPREFETDISRPADKNTTGFVNLRCT
jgi:hypothetical protein